MSIITFIGNYHNLIKRFLGLVLILQALKILIIIIILSHIANALSFNVLGYKISWNEQEVIDEVNNMENIVLTDRFDEEINFINSFKESQIFLKELDYERIGITDISTGITYTAIIEDGIIQHIELGLNEPEAVIKADIPKIKSAVENNNFFELRNHIQLPFKIKLRILLMRWF